MKPNQAPTTPPSYRKINSPKVASSSRLAKGESSQKGNPQVPSSRNLTGVKPLMSRNVDETLAATIVNSLMALLKDSHPLARSNAALTLGAMAQQGLLKETSAATIVDDLKKSDVLKKSLLPIKEQPPRLE